MDKSLSSPEPLIQNEEKTQISSSNDKDVIEYKLYRPKTVDGKEYTQISLDFFDLNGNDIMAAEKQLIQLGQVVVTAPELNKTYLMLISARAAKIPFEALNEFSIRDVSAITRLTQNFLMSGLAE